MATEIIKIPATNLLVSDGWIRSKGFILNPDGTPVLASAMAHLHQPVYRQDAACPGAHDAEATIHVALGATGTVLAFKTGLIEPCTGDATITVDLKKNGISILTAEVELTSAHAAYEVVAAALSSPTLVSGDVLTAVVAVAPGTGALGTGLFAALAVIEDYPS
jgi:hypothetical protein